MSNHLYKTMVQATIAMEIWIPADNEAELNQKIGGMKVADFKEKLGHAVNLCEIRDVTIAACETDDKDKPPE